MSTIATITETIGTTGREFSTITLWAANADDDPTFDAGDDSVGVAHDDSDFDEGVTIDGGGVIGLNSIRLTSEATSNRHDGTGGTGAGVRNTSGGKIFNVTNASVPTTTEWLEFDNNDNNTGGDHLVGVNSGAVAQVNWKNLLVHNADNNGAGIVGLRSDRVDCDAMNCIVYAMEGRDTSYGIDNDGVASTDRGVFNCTVHDIVSTGVGQVARGIALGDVASVTGQNNMSTDAAAAGTAVDYEPASFSNATVDHNLASDTTAAGTGSLDSKASADQYVSTVIGSEDLHLKTGADAINAGVDLGTAPSGVNIDINGRDRDAEADTWDMGAHELVVAGGVTIAVPLATINFANQVPGVAAGKSVAAPLDTLTLSDLVPVVGSSVLVAPPTDTISIGDLVPAVAAGKSVAAPLDAINIAEFVPLISAGEVNIAVPLDAITLNGLVPIITAGAGVVISVPLGTIGFGNLVPAIAAGASIAAPLDALTFTNLVPAVGTGVILDAPLGTIAIAALVPAVAGGGGVVVPLGTIDLAALLPAVAAGVAIVVPLDEITLAGLVPSVGEVRLWTPVDPASATWAARAAAGGSWTPKTPASTTWT